MNCKCRFISSEKINRSLFKTWFPHPDFVQELSKTIIQNKILSNTNKNFSGAMAEKIAMMFSASNYGHTLDVIKTLRVES